MSGNDTSDRVKQALPPLAQSRLQSLRLADGVATLVLDVGGMDQLERERLEAAIREALAGHGDVAEVRIAMTAERGGAAARPRIVAVGSGKGGSRQIDPVGQSCRCAGTNRAQGRTGRC